MSDIPEFKCSACGKCCSKISGFVSLPEKAFIEEYGYGKMPLVQVIPTDEMSFPLWDFEAKRFKEYAEEKKIDARIRPSRGVLDLNSNKFIVVTYQMNSGTCPFLAEDGKCRIYGLKRAFVCNLFPFNKSPFLETGKTGVDDLFGACPNITEIGGELDYDNKDNLIKQLQESFGEAFLASVEHDYVMEWSNKLIIELLKKKIIRPAMNYPYGLLKKRIANSEKVDLMDFLVQSGYKTQKEVRDLIERFERFADARERLHQKG